MEAIKPKGKTAFPNVFLNQLKVRIQTYTYFCILKLCNIQSNLNRVMRIGTNNKISLHSFLFG